MAPDQTHNKDDGFSKPDPSPAPEEPNDDKELSDLENPEKQEEYRKAFIEQMKRRACRGCGDDGPLPF